ncbi:hypothetical protein [Rubinisphaera margarita]|uniref:hypothetical protein n=1 Tax=Rubinisphaera margarita TaxID=2909586 RepID=UPI001EE96045|nr:hypothetical protein [Rubinisphaera margarita]MCG6156849.1 hypothetical protein [Rubinisphaera margarita]
MDAILSGYYVSHTAWLYLSAMLIIAVFYRFRRLWSLRNFDILLLLSLSPGLLMVRDESSYAIGNTWLFVVTALCLTRLLLDRHLTKRSRLEPNMSTPGITFLGICALAFLMTEAITRPAPPGSVTTVLHGERILNAATQQGARESTERLPIDRSEAENPSSDEVTAGPTASLLAMPAVATSRQFLADRGRGASNLHFGIVEETAARIVAILAHLAIVFGLFWIGRSHFKDRTQGLAMATLYLLIPCTSFVVGEVNQVLPSAFILWALICYNRPLTAGVLMGFACGSMFFPVFLLPIWASFFGWRRSIRFFLGVAIVAAVLVGTVALISADAYAFTQQTINRIDFRVLSFDGAPNERGFWNSLHPAYRIPVMVAFLILVITLTAWPWKKNLEVLLSYNAAIIVATQFWYPQLGGVYLLWYLPLMILVAFRPRLLAEKDYPQTQPSVRSNAFANQPRSASSISAPLYR